jgi:hypothetical protein
VLTAAEVKDKWGSRAARSRKTKRKIKLKQNQLEIKRCAYSPPAFNEWS